LLHRRERGNMSKQPLTLRPPPQILQRGAPDYWLDIPQAAPWRRNAWTPPAGRKPRFTREGRIMATAKWYIEVDSYWQNSPSLFIGPYADRQDAQAAADASKAIPADRNAPDVKHNVRYELLNTTQAKRSGMNVDNTESPLCMSVPSNTEQLSRIQALQQWGRS